MELFWFSAAGKELLAQVTSIAKELDFDAPSLALKAKSRIGSESGDNLTRAIEIVLARERAAQRLGAWARSGLFTKQSSEQATRPEIAKHHAKQFAGCKHVLEIGTGAGMDCAALARVARRVTTLESDPELAAMARYNFALQGFTNIEVLCMSLEEFLQTRQLKEIDGIWCDPSRRSEEGERLKGVEAYSPKLSELLELNVSGPIGVKLSPVDSVKDNRVKVFGWMGFGDECLELVVWCRVQGDGFKVTLADRDLTWQAPNEGAPSDFWDDSCPEFIVEVHSAITASGRADVFFSQNGMSLIDDRYGWGATRNKPENSPWYSSFNVLEMLPLDRKRLSKRLADLGWSNRTEIKKRGFDISPEELRRELKLPKPKGDELPYGVVMVTKMRGKPVVFLGQRMK